MEAGRSVGRSVGRGVGRGRDRRISQPARPTDSDVAAVKQFRFLLLVLRRTYSQTASQSPNYRSPAFILRTYGNWTSPTDRPTDRHAIFGRQKKRVKHTPAASRRRKSKVLFRLTDCTLRVFYNSTHNLTALSTHMRKKTLELHRCEAFDF